MYPDLTLWLLVLRVIADLIALVLAQLAVDAPIVLVAVSDSVTRLLVLLLILIVVER